MTDVTFRSGDVTGEAQASVYDLDGVLELVEVSAQGRGFRVQGARARLQGNNLLFEDALATTCVCEDGALYVIRAPSASYDLSREAVSIREGRLEIGSVTVALDDITLSPERLADLTFPIVVEYVDDSEDLDQRGTGLGIRVPSLPVGKGVRLEFGVVGLDSKFPLNGILLLHYTDELVTFDIGKAAKGVQADVSVSEPLLPGLGRDLCDTQPALGRRRLFARRVAGARHRADAFVRWGQPSELGRRGGSGRSRVRPLPAISGRPTLPEGCGSAATA